MAKQALEPFWGLRSPSGAVNSEGQCCAWSLKPRKCFLRGFFPPNAYTLASVGRELLFEPQQTKSCGQSKSRAR